MTPSGVDTQYPFSHGQPGSIVAAPDGNMWLVTDSQLVKIRLVPDPSGEFTSLTPARILDSRDGTGRGGNTNPLGEGGSFDVQITGQGGVPGTPGQVTAVVLNATVVAPSAESFLTIWPAGLARPVISNLNYLPGQVVPNLVTVAVGDDGKVSVYNRFGSAHVVFDVVGFYSRAPDRSGADSMGSRRSDTSTPVTAPAMSDRAARPEWSAEVHRDRQGWRTRGATGVVMNVTVVGPSAESFLTVYPDDVTRPLASNLNYLPGLTVPNLVTMRVPASGIVDFYNKFGAVHVLADVVGYYDGDKTTEAGRFVPMTPCAQGRHARSRARSRPRQDHRRHLTRHQVPRIHGAACVGNRQRRPQRHRHRARHRELRHRLPGRRTAAARVQPELPRRQDRPQPRHRQDLHRPTAPAHPPNPRLGPVLQQVRQHPHGHRHLRLLHRQHRHRHRSARFIEHTRPRHRAPRLHTMNMRRSGVVLVATCIAVWGLSTFAASTTAKADDVAVTSGCSGGEQTWVVPDDVFEVTVDAFGAQGRAITGFSYSEGGLGGRVTAAIAVTPGETLYLYVGCRGDSSSPFHGGFNGGGHGGFGHHGARGGDGGGASDVRRGGNTLADRVLVAGGGGGGGWSGNDSGGGGGAGSPAGSSGAPAVGCFGQCAEGGGGGSQTAGGAAGSAEPFCAAKDGTSGTGGQGGGGDAVSGGGGGGGGYFGGGGGACGAYAGAPATPGQGGGAGGGGGSSYGPIGATFQNAVSAGDGHITITYADRSSAPPVLLTPTFAG